jgi:hypothetical protein
MMFIVSLRKHPRLLLKPIADDELRVPIPGFQAAPVSSARAKTWGHEVHFRLMCRRSTNSGAAKLNIMSPNAV